MRHRDALWQLDIGQVHGVRALRLHLVNKRPVARPQAHVVADPRQMHGQRGPPTSCAKYGDGRHYLVRAAGTSCARRPKRRSVPMRKRTRFDRCRKTMSAHAAAAVTTIEVGLPVAYAMVGSESDASIDPSETYFVSQTVPMKR